MASPNELVPTPSETSNKNYDQYGAKLNFEGANRFCAILEQAAERLELLGVITASGNHGQNQLQGNSRTDVYSLMVNQKELEHSYDRLMTWRNSLRGLSNKHKYLQNQQELNELTGQLRESVQIICQNLRDHPTLLSNLQKIQKNRGELSDVISKSCDDLKSQSFDTLIDTVNQMIANQHLTRDTQAKQLETAKGLEMLEEEVNNEWQQYDRAIQERNAAIQKLTEDLKLSKRVAIFSSKFKQETALASAQALARQRKIRLEQLTKEITQVEKTLRTDNIVAIQTEEYLSRKKQQLDEFADQWTNKKETDFKAKNLTLEELTKVRDSNFQKLTYYKNRKVVEDEDASLVAEEKSIRDQEEKERRELHRRMHLAQCRIKFFWRVFLRKRPAKKKKKKTEKKTFGI